MKKLDDLEIARRNQKEYFLEKNNAAVKKVSDSALVIMEIYNPNKFAIRFDVDQRMLWYIRENGIIEKPYWGIIKPDGFQLLPHRFYLMKGVGVPDGEPVSVIVNQGNNIGIGNKYPSRFDVG